MTSPFAGLKISCRLSSGLVSGLAPIHLDGLLGHAVVWRDGIQPTARFEEMKRVDIPIALEPQGRFHLCSASVGRYERMVRGQYTQRRFPVAEAQSMGDPGLKRINLASGRQKTYRIPIEVGMADRLTWYALGDAHEIEELLSLVTHLGARRAVGRGRIHLRDGWRVEAMPEVWPGFPVLDAEGRALRNLPLDWPGLKDARPSEDRLTYPYWAMVGRAMVAAPAEMTA